MTATATATLQDVHGKKGRGSRIEVKLSATQIDFPYTDEAQRLAQLGNARAYLKHAQQAGAKLKIKELEDKV
ncbi:hypothetical protein [Rhodoferax fermentans]|uniref:Uncharacterized protein n=1 Tax=Rhodoferax fermentans TaxID=28066 RepID=A0A1T1ANW0_RHOFE|nr:hypothetical protein [Rhodoferax fermentans]MBK1683441.1 hypothetical protein [Rhodoferax fermentans]OOV05816.1 hypothetical protein RF819_03000 [Rhodoferax fermentans]